MTQTFDPNFEESAQQLEAMMGESHSPDTIRKVLGKWGGNVEKALDSLIAGDTQADDDIPPLEPVDTQMADRTESKVIDLTTDDDQEMKRALQMSLETNNVRFGPSTRSPHPDWQMTLSNASQSLQPDDQGLDQAIQASLKDLVTDDSDLGPIETTVRDGTRPVALRSDDASLSYACLVLQAIFNVPQVQDQLSKLRPPDDETSAENERILWTLVERFTYMDIGRMGFIVEDTLLPLFNARTLAIPSEGPSKASAELVTNIAHLIDGSLYVHGIFNDRDIPLFNFSTGFIEKKGESIAPRGNSQKHSWVTVHSGNPDVFRLEGDVPNELVARLSTNLISQEGDTTVFQVLVQRSFTVVFFLEHVSMASGAPQPFSYPSTLYMDQFLAENLELAEACRALRLDMRAEINTLFRRKLAITAFGGKDSLKNLESSIYYFEHIAEDKGDKDRRAKIDRTLTKLKGILDSLKQELVGIDQRMSQLEQDIKSVFNKPELQKYPYDLRAVIAYSGLPGRKNIYSYIKDRQGIWWKTVGIEVTKVSEETVLADHNGLHLGAGPYLLIYSEHMPDEALKVSPQWPPVFVNRVEEGNATYLASLQPQQATEVVESEGT